LIVFDIVNIAVAIDLLFGVALEIILDEVVVESVFV